MNIAKNLKDIKYSQSDYINQVFQTRLAGMLSKDNLSNILTRARESEKKNYDMDNITSEDEAQFLENIQINVSRVVNQNITFLADEVRASFFQNHSSNAVVFHQVIKREDYSSYLEQKFASIIPAVYQLEVSDRLETFTKSFLEKFKAEILMQDELPLQDTTYIAAILMQKEQRVLLQRRNETKIYRHLTEKVFKDNPDFVRQLSQIFLACNMIKRLDDNTAFNERVEIEVVSELVRKNFCKLEKFDEFSPTKFMALLAEERVSSYVQDKKDMSIVSVINQLNNKSFNPTSILSQFKF